jgi:DNA-binding NarL/FixJ family response regulator
MTLQAIISTPPTAEQPLLGARVLLAEDDAIVSFDLRRVLHNAGAEVVGPAATLVHTLTLAQAGPLSCAVLDVNLRRETVFPAAEVLRDRSVSIIFHSGAADLEILQREWPQAMVLSKPAPPKMLVRTVCKACRGHDFCAGYGCKYCL